MAKTKARARIGISELEKRIGKNRSTIWRRYTDGAEGFDPTFPKPHYLGESRSWFLDEIEAWEAAQMARPREARRAPRNLTPPAVPVPTP